MKILKSSISLLLVLGGGIGLTSYLTSCSCSNSISPHGSIPFTNEYFTWTTSSNELTITGLKDNPDLKKYNTLSIPATCIDNDIEYRVTAIGDWAFQGEFGDVEHNSITKLDLTNATNLQTIGEWAFNFCDLLTGSLTIPNSVTSIGEGAFVRCYGFTGSLTIGNSVTSIGTGAFALCSGFTGSLIIPNSVVSIGTNAFHGCSGFIGTLTIPNSVIEIRHNAFEGCSGFNETLTIGNLVDNIGHSAFKDCSAFDIIDVSAWTSVPIIESYAFEGFNNTDGGTVIVPSDLGITLSTFPSLPDTWSLQEV